MHQPLSMRPREWRFANTFNSFWQGSELSPLAWACYESFATHGERVVLYSYNKSLEVPNGVILKDARKILPRSRLFKALNSYSAFSDIFRYELLQRRGGWWVDADVVYLRRRAHSPPSELFAWEDHRHVNCGQIRLRKNSPIASKALAALNALDMSNISWADPGPVMFTKVLRDLGMLEKALPRQVFYPLHWVECYKLVLAETMSETERLTASSDFIHAWGSQFRQFGFDVWANCPQENSFLDRVYKESGVYKRYVLTEPDWASMRSAIDNYLNQEYIQEFKKDPLRLDLSSVKPATP